SVSWMQAQRRLARAWLSAATSRSNASTVLSLCLRSSRLIRTSLQMAQIRKPTSTPASVRMSLIVGLLRVLIVRGGGWFVALELLVLDSLVPGASGDLEVGAAAPALGPQVGAVGVPAPSAGVPVQEGCRHCGRA